MLITFIAVACGGALGALVRFGTVVFSQFLFASRFPFGILLVNCLGSFLIGFIMHFFMERNAVGSECWRLFLVVGFLGAYTTFSSFVWDTWVLYDNGHWLSALVNIVVNNVGTFFMVLLGIQSARTWVAWS